MTNESGFPTGLAQPALRALANAGIKSLKDLTKITEQHLAEMHGMGPKGIRILSAAMKEQKLQFAKSDTLRFKH